jgi:flagellar hook-associated protein 1 FlgK
MRLAIKGSDQKSSRGAHVSLNGIISSALSALETNSSALNVVSNNIANINTPGYAQRVVNQEVLATGGQLTGVDIADIERVANQFLTQQTLSANASSSQYSAQNSLYSQVNALLGQVGSGSDLPSQLADVYSALGTASLSPGSSTSQQAVLTAFQNFASSISTLSSGISGLQDQADQQVVADVGSANSLIQQISSLNQQIQSDVASGDTDSGLLDQRDSIVQNLSQLIGVTTAQQSDGQLLVSTANGTNLIGNGTYAQLSYSGGSSNGTYGPIEMQTVNATTGQSIGPSQALDPDLGSGEIAGLVQMRDGTLANLQQQLGNFAQQSAQSFNAQYNANAAYPPPGTLTGRDTGLLSGDALNFTGDTTIAVTNASGNLVSSIAVDFDSGTLSVNGGSPVSFGGTIGSFVTALNGALGSSGSASFANGTLSLNATSGNGVVIQDSATTPSSCGGVGFSQFFGLNDLFQSAAPSIASTGLTSSDAGGFANGGTMQLELQGPNGQIAKQANITVTSGMTIGEIVNALNTAFGSAASFSLSSSGTLTMTPGSGYSSYTLNVTGDSTQRGSTGMSVSELFGLGAQQTVAQAQNFAVNPAIAQGAQALAFAQPQITASTVPGDAVVLPGDNSGLLALQNVNSAQVSFPAAGGITAQTNTLGNYADAFYQNIATQTQTTQTNATAASDQLTEAQTRQSQVSGVNLDEELSNMVMYQQAYGAAARVLQTADQVYATLLQIQ